MQKSPITYPFDDPAVVTVKSMYLQYKVIRDWLYENCTEWEWCVAINNIFLEETKDQYERRILGTVYWRGETSIFGETDRECTYSVIFKKPSEAILYKMRFG